MDSHTKALVKRLEGLERARAEHVEKLRTHGGDKPFLSSYWEKEIAGFDEQIRALKVLLKDKK